MEELLDEERLEELLWDDEVLIFDKVNEEEIVAQVP